MFFSHECAWDRGVLALLLIDSSRYQVSYRLPEIPPRTVIPMTERLSWKIYMNSYLKR